MPILPSVAIGTLLVAALLIAIFRSDTPANPTAPKQAALAAVAPLVCVLISYVTYRAIDSYLAVHLTPPKPWIMPIRIGMFLGIIAPLFVGVYFASQTARAANRGLRFIGAVEMLVCGFYGAVLLFASTVGFG